MEDFVTWVDTSAIKKHIMEYNELVLKLNNILKLRNNQELTHCFFLFLFFCYYYRETTFLWPKL